MGYNLSFKSKKKSKRNLISSLLIVVGIIVCLIPFGGKLYTQHQEKLMYEQYLKDQAAISENLDAIDEAFNETDEPNTSGSNRPAAIGRISISKIKSNLNILEGSSTKELRWGAGHVTGTAAPGYLGNCCLAGHRNYTFGSYFSRLGEVEIGDTIKLESGGQTFAYTVYEIDVVDPSDVSVLLQGTKDRAIVTLITCHPKGKNTQRLIVKAELPVEKALVPEGYVPPTENVLPETVQPVPNETSNPVTSAPPAATTSPVVNTPPQQDVTPEVDLAEPEVPLSAAPVFEPYDMQEDMD